MQSTERSDTELVLAARGNGESEADSQAYGELFNRWFDSSWNVARNIVRQDELAADVAQDSLLAAWQRLDQLDNPNAFGGWLLRITRNRALNRLERERRTTASGDDVVSGLRDGGLPDPTGANRPLGPDSISEVRDRQELVWAASAALGERDASLLDLHLRHGLSPAEIASELGVAANNAHQQLYRLRNKLGDAIGSYLLWRNGRPLCDGLAAAVSGDVAFDKSVARAVAKHQESCERCSERRAALIDPNKLFASAPMILAPAQLKLQAASGLQSAGISFVPGHGGSATLGSEVVPTSSSTSTSSSSSASSTPTSSTSTFSSSSPTSTSTFSASTSSQVGGGPASYMMAAVDGVGKTAFLVGASAAVALVAAGLTVLTLTNRSDDVATSSLGEAEITEEQIAGPEANDDAEDESSASEADEQASGGGPLEPSQPEATESPATDSTAVESPATDSTAVEVSTGDEAPATTVPTEPNDDPPVVETETTTQVSTTTTDAVDTTPTTVQDEPEDPDDQTEPTDPPSDTIAEPDQTTVAPALPSPEILRFGARSIASNLECTEQGHEPYAAAWIVLDAASVTFSYPDGSREGGPLDGHLFCATSGDTVRIVAVRANGAQAEQSVTL